MKTSEVKHAATAPSRMLRRLEEFSTRNICLEYISRKIISDPLALSVEAMFLVPGGRHLVLLTWPEGLEVWDLEIDYHLANPIQNQRCIPGALRLCGVAQQSSPGEGVLRIAIASRAQKESPHSEQYVLCQRPDTRGSDSLSLLSAVMQL
jgi:hypothetical protein